MAESESKGHGCLPIVVALIGGLFTLLGIWYTHHLQAAPGPVPVAPTGSTGPVIPPSDPEPKQASVSDRGCSLRGKWQIAASSPGAGPDLVFSARFEDGKFVIATSPTELECKCTLSADALDIVPPNVGLSYPNQEVAGFVMLMPSHFERTDDTTYIAEKPGFTFTIQRRSH